MAPTLSKAQVLQQRGDLSPFLIHLTRSGTYKEWADISGRPRDQLVTLNAKTSLEHILGNATLEARCPFGYFNYKVKQKNFFGGWNNPKSGVNRSWLRAVCFTETPVDHVHLQCNPIYGRQCQFEPYGLAFFEERVRIKNGNPVVYYETRNRGIQRALDAIPILPNVADFRDFMPLVEGFGPPIYKMPMSEVDFRWEREWRVAGDFAFTAGDVAFGLCPAAHIAHFEALVGNRFLFIDPTALLASVKTKLKTDPRLSNLV